MAAYEIESEEDDLLEERESPNKPPLGKIITFNATVLSGVQYILFLSSAVPPEVQIAITVMDVIGQGWALAKEL